MQSNLLTIQYLEPSDSLENVDTSSVVRRLRIAAESLPISHLLIGWHLPQPLLEACRLEAEQLGMRFIRWQPLLTTDQDITPDPSWQVVGLDGQRVPGYRGLPEFTFFCPNHPEVREALSSHLEALVSHGIYQGFFLDRVRFPSPSLDPINGLACFCEHCQRKAAGIGLILDEIRQEILRQTSSYAGRLSLVKSLLTGKPDPEYSGKSFALRAFIAFRKNNISEFLAFISRPLRAAGLEIGLDCFSPSLTHMVGQDLKFTSTLVDWVKLMTYAHTLAPAGLPYELMGTLRYLTVNTQLDEAQALYFIHKTTDLPLPVSIQELQHEGLSPLAVEAEVVRGIASSSAPVLAGIELIDLPGVTYLSNSQIMADLGAIKHANPAGLAISWDLWHIPPERLELVRQVFT